MKLLLTLTALLASASLGLAADEEKAKQPQEGDGTTKDLFQRLDTNADGTLSKEEFLAAPFAKKDPGKAEIRFTALDADGDSQLTREEFPHPKQ